MDGNDSRPAEGKPVLVTGAGGFVGGHVARRLAAEGYRVRAWSRRPVPAELGDPPVEWFHGDLCRPDDVAAAVRGVASVVHAAGWVSLGPDRTGLSHRVNVVATVALLDSCEAEGVETFVHTSTLWTVAAGTSDYPADEQSAWNLDAVRSPYCDSKREAEQLVLERDRPGFRTTAICPGMVVGPRDARPSSTRLLLTMARHRVVMLPNGGIPLIDAGVLALAHQRALEGSGAGGRFAVVGPYTSYRNLARMVAKVTGRPQYVLKVPDALEPLLTRGAEGLQTLTGGRLGDLSRAAVAGGFLKLYVLGTLADRTFGLQHASPFLSIREALVDHFKSGRAPWLRHAIRRAVP